MYVNIMHCTTGVAWGEGSKASKANCDIFYLGSLDVSVLSSASDF